MTRRLRLISVESGRCQNCHKDVGEHSIEGICPTARHQRHADVPEPAYHGEERYAFVDIDSPEAKSLLRHVLETVP